jgi:hypothetical protein
MSTRLNEAACLKKNRLRTLTERTHSFRPRLGRVHPPENHQVRVCHDQDDYQAASRFRAPSLRGRDENRKQRGPGPLEDVNIRVIVAEDQFGNEIPASSDPNDPQALFFIRIESMGKITGTTGQEIVDPSATGAIHWLIVPAPRASENLENGASYYVGDTYYSLSGDSNIIDVTTDHIFVLPNSMQ